MCPGQSKLKSPERCELVTTTGLQPNNQYYVMSADSNFNPNGKLDGNWTQLELVRPQPQGEKIFCIEEI
jgi:hypothetical protein